MNWCGETARFVQGFETYVTAIIEKQSKNIKARTMRISISNHLMMRCKQKKPMGRSMKLNIFEGARRIALGCGAIWLIGCLAYAVFSEPYASVTYVVPEFGAAAVKGKNCGSNDALRHIEAETSKGLSVRVTLCFTASEASDGRMLVPYTLSTNNQAVQHPSDKYTVLMNEPYSTSVRDYTELVGNRFKFSESDMKYAENELWDACLRLWMEALQFALGGVAVFWIIVAGVGWIVRGFMGIQRGKDVRPAG